MKKKIPTLLVYFRLALAPVMVLLTLKFGDAARNYLVLALLAGLVSDVFDGIIARKLGVATETLRKLDSNVDAVFWCGALLSAWLLNPEIIARQTNLIVLLVVFEVFCYLLSYIKFRKTPANHSYISKAWAIAVFVALTAIIGFSTDKYVFEIMFLLGFVSYIDNILILLLLPEWKSDTRSCFRALKIYMDAH
jgi:CDP-diacylglycerol--glycerol-3-phosphate 3-phosphatidyltransferase